MTRESNIMRKKIEQRRTELIPTGVNGDTMEFVLIHDTSPQKEKLQASINAAGDGGFRPPSFWKEYEPGVQQSFFQRAWLRIKKSWTYYILSRVIQAFNIFNFIYRLAYIYPIKELSKAIMNIINGHKVARSVTRILLSTIFVTTLILCGSVIFPGLGSWLALQLGLGINILIAPVITQHLSMISITIGMVLEYAGFVFAGIFAGVTLSKHIARLYSYLRYGDTNPDKYSLSLQEELLLERKGMDQQISKDILSLIQEKRHSYKSIFLTFQNPIKEKKLAFYKKLLTKLKQGNTAYAKTFLEYKLERKDAKIAEAHKQFEESHVNSTDPTYLKYKTKFNDIFDNTSKMSNLTECTLKEKLKQTYKHTKFTNSIERAAFDLWRKEKLRSEFKNRFFSEPAPATDSDPQGSRLKPDSTTNEPKTTANHIGNGLKPDEQARIQVLDNIISSLTSEKSYCHSS